MKQYIDKNAVVAAIERRVNNLYPKNGQGMVITKILKDHYEDLKDFLNTLEVGEIDIENIAIKEWDNYIKKIDGEPNNAYMLIKREDYIKLAKHFFELRLKAREE